MKPMFTLRSQLMRPKDALGELKQSGVVYSIPCEDCDVEYMKRDELFIEQAKNGIANRDNGMTLPEVYKPIVRN